MHVVVVGAGLGGLACAIACRREGFEVTVIDQFVEPLRIGDSIGFGPNTSQFIKRWGLWDQFWPISLKSDTMEMRSYDTGEIILIDDAFGKSEAQYGTHSLVGHRGDYHMILFNHCKSLGVTVRTNAKVVDYDADKPSAILESGEEILADAVICADGVKSIGRSKVLNYFDKPHHSGYAVYRTFVDAKVYEDDPIVQEFIKKGDAVHAYIAPDKHGMLCSLKGGKEINAVLTHKDSADIDEGWMVPGRKEDVMKLIEDWNPLFRRVWEKVDYCLDWKLVFRPCLDKFVADSGLLAVMGDAAHPFLPTSTQGASQAMEDGITIAKCLSLAGEGNVPLALHSYFEIRHEYVKKAQATGITTRTTWHNAHDHNTGKLREDFDADSLKLASEYLWENDAERTAEEQWPKVSALVQERLSKI